MRTRITLLLLLGSLVGMAETHQKIKYLLATDREYVVHVPSSYDASQPRGLLVFLHELGGNIDGHAALAQNFADKYGWIVAMPQSLRFLKIDPSVFPAGSLPDGIDQVLNLAAWNSGIKAKTLQTEINGALDDMVKKKIVAALAKMYLGIEFTRWENTKDVAFVIDMLNQVKKDYAIAEDSIFVSGMSMGGFMSHRMLIEKGQYFNAGVPVSGLVGDALMNDQPKHGAHPRVMHIHGTSDNVVGYDGISGFYDYMARVGLSAEETVDYWRRYNGCGDEAEVHYYPNLNPYDGMTFERYTYANDEEDNCVAFIKVNNGYHEWYGVFEGKDIDYMEEIYQFCANKKKTAPVVPTGAYEVTGDRWQVAEKVMVDGEIYIRRYGKQYNVVGQER